MPHAPKTFRAPRAEAASSEYDRRRGSAASRGYGRRWERYRAWFLAHPVQVVCGMCGRAASEVVDHVEAVKGASDSLFWEPTNHLGECQPCHRRKSILCDGGFGQARVKEGAELLERLKRAAIQRAEKMGEASCG